MLFPAHREQGDAATSIHHPLAPQLTGQRSVLSAAPSFQTPPQETIYLRNRGPTLFMSSLFSVGTWNHRRGLCSSQSQAPPGKLTWTLFVSPASLEVPSWDRLNWGRMGEPSSHCPPPKSCGGVPSKWAQWGEEYDISGTGKGI